MITRFNESIKNCWTNDKLKTHLINHDYIIGCLSKYLDYRLGDESNYYVQDFFFVDKKFTIIYDDSNSGGNKYTVKTEKEYDELIEFLNDIEFFTDTKKYNL